MKGAIFDLDGTLIDSMGLWLDIDREFFAKRNMSVPADYQRSIAHLGFKECAAFTVGQYLPNEKEEDVIAEWREMSLEKYAAKDSARYMKPYAAGISEIAESVRRASVRSHSLPSRIVRTYPAQQRPVFAVRRFYHRGRSA